MANLNTIQMKYSNTEHDEPTAGQLATAELGINTYDRKLFFGKQSDTDSTTFQFGAADLENTAVTAGTYTLSTITVDAQGRLTAASSGSGGGSGTVTSVVASSSATNGLSLSGGTITSTGTIAIQGTLAINNGDWSGTDLSVANGGTGAGTFTDGGILFGNGTGAIQASAVLAAGEILIGDGTTEPTILDVGSASAITVLGTVGTGTWQGDAINQTYLTGQSGTNTGDNTVCTSGAATTAAALLTGRTFLCDVGETDASTAFTGAANCTDIGVTGLLPVGNGGTGKNAGYNYSEWDTAYDNSVTGISDSGSSTITLTLTQQDSGTLTTSFSNPQGTVTSIAAGAGFSFSTITGSGTIAVDGHLQDLDALGAVSSTVDQFMVSTGAGAWAYETPSTVRSTLNVADGSTANAGTVTSVATAGTENGLTLTGGSITSSGTITLGGTLAINNGDWSGTDLSVANGGTGASTLTANGVLIGNGTSAISAVDMSTKGHILVGDGSGNPRMLAVGGTNDHVLTVASGETTGVKWAAVSGGGGSGDVVAGSTFTTAGVIMACNGDDKEIDAPGTTLTTNSQGMTVGGALTCTGAFTLGSSVSLDENATWGTISGTAFQLGKEDATYMYDIHSGYTGSVAITTTSNYFHVQPEVGPGVGAIPVSLPDGSSEEGLTITIVNDCAANPAATLEVKPQGSDVLYDGTSNTAISAGTSGVTIAAFRGANKTFVTIEDGIWIVMA